MYGDRFGPAAGRSSRRPLKYTIAAATWDNTLISQMRTALEEETLVAQGFVGLLSVWTRPPQSAETMIWTLGFDAHSEELASSCRNANKENELPSELMSAFGTHAPRIVDKVLYIMQLRGHRVLDLRHIKTETQKNRKKCKYGKSQT